MGRSQARLAFVRPACGHPSRPQPRPAPPPRPLLPGSGDPAAAAGSDENGTRSAAGGRARAEGCPASASEVSGAVRPAAGLRGGMCAGAEGVRLGQEDLLSHARGRFPSRCLPTGNRALGSREPQEPRVPPGNPHREARSRLSGEVGAFGTDSSQVLPGRALGASLQAFPALPVCSFASIPLSPLPTLCQILSCDFSVVP